MPLCIAPLRVLCAVVLITLLGACNPGLPSYEPPLEGGDDEPFPDDDDDTAPDDDDTALDDDDTAPDDDDTAPDDDDTALDDDDSSPSDDFEGDEPGECSDGADNDQDGYFDCDDPDCAGSPDCEGDDDDSWGDDDDDVTPSSGAPVITSVVDTWLPSTSELQFLIYVSDADCDLGNPTLHWVLDGVTQGPLTAGGPAMGCGGVLTFGLTGVTPGYSYTLSFSIEDEAGNISTPPYTLTTTAS